MDAVPKGKGTSRHRSPSASGGEDDWSELPCYLYYTSLDRGFHCPQGKYCYFDHKEKLGETSFKIVRCLDQIKGVLDKGGGPNDVYKFMGGNKAKPTQGR